MATAKAAEVYLVIVKAEVTDELFACVSVEYLDGNMFSNKCGTMLTT